MILVDTSVWIDHLHAPEPALADLLGAARVASHPAVIEELALGSLRNRGLVIDLLENLLPFPVLSHDELMLLVDSHRLWGRGLSAVDVHLLGSAAVRSGSQLWTRDRRLQAACRDVNVPEFTPATW